MNNKTFISILIGALLFAWSVYYIGNLLFSPDPVTTTRPNPITVLHWKNRSGDSVTSVQGRADQFTIPSRITDSIARVYGTREKYLLDYIITLQRSQANVAPVPDSKVIDFFPADTASNCPPAVRSMRQDFANPYYQVRAQIGDSSYLQLQAFDTLTAVWKKVKQGSIFNRRTLLQLDISSANPYNHITGITGYRAPARPPKKIGIGLQLGYGISGANLTPAPYVGVGISYNIIRL